jgi:hypothetical protein
MGENKPQGGGVGSEDYLGLLQGQYSTAVKIRICSMI